MLCRAQVEQKVHSTITILLTFVRQNSRGGKLRKTQSMYLGEITQTAVCQLVQSSTFLNTFPPGSPRSEATAIEDFRRQATTLWSDTNPSLPVMFGSFKRD